MTYLLAACAFTATMGKSHDEKKKWLAAITPLGRIACLIALLALGATIYKEIRESDEKAEKERQAAAKEKQSETEKTRLRDQIRTLQDVAGRSQVPLYSHYVEYDGKRGALWKAPDDELLPAGAVVELTGFDRQVTLEYDVNSTQFGESMNNLVRRPVVSHIGDLKTGKFKWALSIPGGAAGRKNGFVYVFATPKQSEH